jgi:CRP/FNR family cyclic AMP-dependent transcriptional regulator
MHPLKGAGDLVGVDAAISGAAWEAGVRGTTASPLHGVVEGVEIPGERFGEYLLAYPRVCRVLAGELATRAAAAERRCTDLAWGEPGARLAGALLNLISVHQVRRQGWSDTSFRLTQGALASWVGTSRETVEKLLKGWRDRGIIETRHQQIRVYDVDKLAELARVDINRVELGLAPNALDPISAPFVNLLYPQPKEELFSS